MISLQSVNYFDKVNEVVESSEMIRKRIMETRKRQYERYGCEICNGRVPYERLMKMGQP